MSAFTRTQPDATWTTGNYVPSIADWKSLSAKVFGGVNGTRGGAWVSTDGSTFTGNFRVEGPFAVAYGGTLEVQPTGQFQFGSDLSWPLWGAGHAFRSRRILHSLMRRSSAQRAFWQVDPRRVGVQSLALVTARSGLSVAAPHLRFELRVHDGALLTRGEFKFRVPERRSKPPVAMPRFRTLRIDRQGEAVPLTSTAAGADESGWISPPQATTAAQWYADGQVQTLTVPCDQNNRIDTSLYSYIAELIEEVAIVGDPKPGEIDGNVIVDLKEPVRAMRTDTLVGTPNGLASPIDGIPLNAGDRVLIAGTNANNGIWIASAGNWARASDFTNSFLASPGTLVPVTEGVLNGGRYMAVSPPFVSDFGTNAGAVVNFDAPIPKGNLYHSLLLEFEGIEDGRFQ